MLLLAWLLLGLAQVQGGRWRTDLAALRSRNGILTTAGLHDDLQPPRSSRMTRNVDTPPPPPNLPNADICGRLTSSEMPWFVAVVYNIEENVESTRGGSLVTQKHVISTADRFFYSDHSMISADRLTVLLGTKDVYNYKEDPAVQLIKVLQVVVPPDYDHANNKKVNNLAVLVLASPAQFTAKVRPVCAWSPRGDSVVGRTGSGIGWQWDANDKRVIESWSLPAVSRAQCRASHNSHARRVTDKHLCAGHRNESFGGPCNQNGDSLYFDEKTPGGDTRWVLRGVLSTVLRAPGDYCDHGQYFAFTDVNQHATWLHQVIFPDDPEDPECGASEDSTFLVHHGSDTKPGDWPWVVAILVKDDTVDLGLDFQCGGTLITKTHVVTAAHCVAPPHGRPLNRRELIVIPGKFNLRSWTEPLAQPRDVAEIVIHEGFSKSGRRDSDLAVLVLSFSVSLNPSVHPVCPWNPRNEVVETRGSVVGWGSDELGNPISDVPKLVRLPLVSTEECRNSHRKFANITTDNTFCAGDRNGSGPCNGDSGSGMYFPFTTPGGQTRWMLRGLVSRSLLNKTTKECNLKEYVVFTDLTKFQPWLRDVMRNKRR